MHFSEYCEALSFEIVKLWVRKEKDNIFSEDQLYDFYMEVKDLCMV